MTFGVSAAWPAAGDEPSWVSDVLGLVNTWLLDPSPRVLTMSATAEAWLHGVSLASFLGLFCLLAWTLAHPPATLRSRSYRLLAVLALAVAPLCSALLYRHEQTLLLGPRLLADIAHQLLTAWQLNMPLGRALQPHQQVSLIFTGVLLMTVLAAISVLFGGRARALRGAALVVVVLLAVAPVRQFALLRTEASALAEELATGERLFEARCSAAGVVRLQPVQNVEGVRLKTLRAEAGPSARRDRDWPDAGIPRDRTGMAYALSFLDFDYRDERENAAWSVPGLPGTVTLKGYAFVDVPQADGSYLRYRSPGAGEPIPPGEAARYEVSIAREDTPQERLHWVAGARVTVTDTATSQVVGELLVVSHVPPQRRDALNLGRRDWAMARICPSREDVPGALARMFVEQAVEPVRGRP